MGISLLSDADIEQFHNSRSTEGAQEALNAKAHTN